MKTRRAFLKTTTTAAALGMVSPWAAADTREDRWGRVLPTRRLTRDGARVTAFSLGGWHVGAADSPAQAEAMIERAMELGVRFFDNARIYHGGRAEDYYGRFLTPKYREDVFLMTKAYQKTAEAVRRELDDSLRALKTDTLDLWQIHTLTTREDVDNRLDAGVLDVFLEARASGKVRHIGFTGHRDPGTLLYFLDVLKSRGIELETCQIPLNVCDASYASFQHQVLPVLLAREYGVIGMKTMAGGSLLGDRFDFTPKDLKTEDIPDLTALTDITPADLHRYVYSLPVSSLCSGCRTVTEIEENIGVLRRMRDLSEAEMARLVELARPYAGFAAESYKRVLS